jgi:hypothetical protein
MIRRQKHPAVRLLNVRTIVGVGAAVVLRR